MGDPPYIVFDVTQAGADPALKNALAVGAPKRVGINLDPGAATGQLFRQIRHGKAVRTGDEADQPLAWQGLSGQDAGALRHAELRTMTLACGRRVAVTGVAFGGFGLGGRLVIEPVRPRGHDDVAGLGSSSRPCSESSATSSSLSRSARSSRVVTPFSASFSIMPRLIYSKLRRSSVTFSESSASLIRCDSCSTKSTARACSSSAIDSSNPGWWPVPRSASRRFPREGRSLRRREDAQSHHRCSAPR